MRWVRRLVALAAVAGSAVAWGGSSREETCRADGSGNCKAGGKAGGRLQAYGAKEALPSADLITQEVNELKGFIGLCEERIELLKELQNVVTSGHNVSLPESHVKMLKEKLPLMSAVTSEPDKMTTGSPEDYLVSKRIIVQEEPVGFVKFLPLRNQRTSSPSSTAQTAMPSALLVAVQAEVNGSIKLFTPSGEEVLSMATGHKAVINQMAVSPSHDEYFVATSDVSGQIRTHKVNVRQKRQSKEKKKKLNSTEEKKSSYLDSQVNVTAAFGQKMQMPAGSDGEVPTITALGVASQQGTKYFVAGDSEGKISIFTRNGSLRARIDAAVTPGGIEGLHTQLSNLIFRAGPEWGFVNLEKLEVSHMDCPKFDGQITNAIIDSQMSSRVLVADEEGTVWVFNVKDKKQCKIEHRFPKGSTQGPVDLASVRGFTLALERNGSGMGDPAAVVALNMSVVGKKREPGQKGPSSLVWRSGRRPVKDWAVYKRYQQGDLLAFLSDDGTEIEIMELLMTVYQAAPTGDTMGNFKLPVIAVAIVLVLGYQYVKQKGKFGGSSSKFGGGGGGSAFGDTDFSALRNKKLGKGGLGGLKGLGAGRAGLGGKKFS